MIIAVDFDGTLCDDIFPDIGEPHSSLIADLILFKSIPGNELVLWTCREGDAQVAAIEWCKKQGLVFDFVNENTDEHKKLYDTDCRKVFADLYIEDKCTDWKDFKVEDFILNNDNKRSTY